MTHDIEVLSLISGHDTSLYTVHMYTFCFQNLKHTVSQCSSNIVDLAVQFSRCFIASKQTVDILALT